MQPDFSQYGAVYEDSPDIFIRLYRHVIHKQKCLLVNGGFGALALQPINLYSDEQD